MTPTEITDQARRITNTFGSNFVSDSELLAYLQNALKEASHYAKCVEQVDVMTSVVSQATYALTSTAFAVKYITYDGFKVKPVTFREALAVNYALVDSSAAGTPSYYYLWNSQLIFIPASQDSDKEIKVYSYAEHPSINASSTVLIPGTLQHYTVDYVAYRIFQKELNPAAAQYYQLWKANLEIMKREMVKRHESDGFRVVQTEESLVYGVMGIV
jgi:hypothetical protein